MTAEEHNNASADGGNIPVEKLPVGQENIAVVTTSDVSGTAATKPSANPSVEDAPIADIDDIDDGGALCL